MTVQTMAVLKVLLTKPREPRYGLDIAKETGLKSGTLYPALARLEHAGWIEGSWEQVDASEKGRPRRRYYRLTAEGAVSARRVLEEATRRFSLDWTPTPGLPGAGGLQV
jgi:PadR family transcriptional regulator PadR